MNESAFKSDGQEFGANSTKKTNCEDNNEVLGFDPSCLITQVPEPSASLPTNTHELRQKLPPTTAATTDSADTTRTLSTSTNLKRHSIFSFLKHFCCACYRRNDPSEFDHSKSSLEEPSVVFPSSAPAPILITSQPHHRDPTHVLEEHSPTPSESQKQKSLLPLQHPRDAGKKCLILDLDEAMVHSSFKPVPDADFIVSVNFKGKFHNVYVLKRPHLDGFLEALGREFEVVCFTASTRNYADPVLDLLDPGRRIFRHRLFREHCVFYKGVYVKDLTRLGRPMEDCIIMDNSPLAYAFQPENAVPCQSWYNNQEDTELLELQTTILNLKSVKDVRTVLGVADDADTVIEEEEKQQGNE
ncbi:UNVERIFIED_CONTAM: hypothetical protein HDU68_002636 [Siphonaria sp. JEL0065]|nr:hypothetical protein HDU68_002636 [Siphonaria sp. JEL0065]